MNGLHLDIKWSMYRPEYFETILSQAADLGIDTILLEFENKLFFDWLKPALHPERWTKKELKQFLTLAKKKNLTVIPSVPLLGHMEWILQWPHWAYLRENNDFHEICPSHPVTPEFVGRLLEETIRLFPDAPMIHLGGDESRSLGTCPSCKTKSKADLYVAHYRPLIEQVERAGKRAMLYGDILLAHPQVLEKISRSVVICDWDYWSGQNTVCRIWGSPVQVKPGESWAKVPAPLRRFKKYFLDRKDRLIDFPYAAFLKDQGFDVVTLSAARSCGDNYCAPLTRWHVLNAMAGARTARTHNLMGTIITSWQVRFNHLETNWPAIAASAWSYQDPSLSYDELSDRFATEFFGLAWPTIFNDLDLLWEDLPGIRGGHSNPCPPNFNPPYLRGLYQDPASEHSRYLEKQQPLSMKAFRRGLGCLNRRKAKVTRHAHAYDHWLLAAETLVHKAQLEPVLKCLIQGQKVSPSLRTHLMNESHVLADRHLKLFEKTILPQSMQMELEVRFGEPLAILQGKRYPADPN